MRNLLISAVFLAMATLASSADATDRTEKGREAYESGRRAYRLGEWADAIAGFETAYKLTGDSALLFNLGQAHAKAGHVPEAIRFYQQFLRDNPKARNRATVEARIQELEAQATTRTGVIPPVADNPVTAAAPVTAPAEPTNDAATTGTAGQPDAGRQPPATALQLRAQEPPTVSKPLVAPAPEAPTESPFYTRWWFWTATGAVVAGAVVAAVILGSGTEVVSPGSFGSGKVVVR